MCDAVFPPYYAGLPGEKLHTVWAVLPFGIPIRKASCQQWMQWTNCRIFDDPEIAWKSAKPQERLICLPTGVEFEQSFAWYKWAHTFISELNLAVSCRSSSRLRLHPKRPPNAVNQVRGNFQSLVLRFYQDGLFAVAERCNVARTFDELYLCANDNQYAWDKMVAHTYSDNEYMHSGTWRLLWTTVCEMLEWWASCAGKKFSNDSSQCGETLSAQGIEATEEWQERDCIADLLSAWSICSLHSPNHLRPRGIDAVERYVFTDLMQHFRNLGQGRVLAVRQCPEIVSLRVPTQLPRDWFWRRQVRTRKGGRYFGFQDILFYETREKAIKNQGRCRSRREVDKKVHQQ